MKKIKVAFNFIRIHLINIFRSFFLKPKIVTGDYGLKYQIFPDSSLDYLIKNEGVLDDWHGLKKIENLIDKNGVIFDIGANVGMMSMPLAKIFVPSGKVYAFEPDAQNLDQLNKNIQLNNFNNIFVMPIALQDDANKKNVSFNIRRAVDGNGNENRGLSSLKNIAKFQKQIVVVSASTIDEQVKALNLTRLDFIKIDVEGAEFLVLSGGRESIQKFLPIVQYEYSNVLDKLSADNNTESCFNFMQKLNYKQYYVTAKAEFVLLSTPNPEMIDCNVVCFPPNNIPNF